MGNNGKTYGKILIVPNEDETRDERERRVEFIGQNLHPNMHGLTCEEFDGWYIQAKTLSYFRPSYEVFWSNLPSNSLIEFAARDLIDQGASPECVAAFHRTVRYVLGDIPDRVRDGRRRSRVLTQSFIANAVTDARNRIKDEVIRAQHAIGPFSPAKKESH